MLATSIQGEITERCLRSIPFPSYNREFPRTVSYENVGLRARTSHPNQLRRRRNNRTDAGQPRRSLVPAGQTARCR
jgi:hypothetical protein